jgi:hypothetical protein
MRRASPPTRSASLSPRGRRPAPTYGGFPVGGVVGGDRVTMIWPMIVLGVVLMLLGLLLAVPILWTIGIILLVVGLILLVLGKLGRSVGGRRHFW